MRNAGTHFAGSCQPGRTLSSARRTAVATLVSVTALSACATPAERKESALFSPTETVLELVSVLRRHVPDDTYRFPPAADFTGRNVYRASLIRLENLELVHAETLRAGHMDGVIAFSKGRSMERLRAYDLAAQQYRRAAERDETLREEALRSAVICSEIHDAVGIGMPLIDPLSQMGSEPLPLDPEEVIEGLEERSATLDALREQAPHPHYRAIILQEMERSDVTRARYFSAMRHALPNGHVRAVGEWQRVVTRHAASQLRLRHLLELAELYQNLAREYIAAVPPESLSFDPPKFQELTDATAQIYRRVAAEDGTPEKLEAARNLEAFLAFTLRVDSDRFSQ